MCLKRYWRNQEKKPKRNTYAHGNRWKRSNQKKQTNSNKKVWQ